AEEPLAGVASRYRRLSVSTRKGNRAKGQLVQLELVREFGVTIPEGRIVLLELTARGLALLMSQSSRDPPALPSDGTLHAYWKQRVGDLYRRRGWKVEYERYIGHGKRVDIHAEQGERRVAIEVVT